MSLKDKTYQMQQKLELIEYKLNANETSGLLRSNVTLIKQISKASILIAIIFDLLHDCLTFL